MQIFKMFLQWWLLFHCFATFCVILRLENILWNSEIAKTNSSWNNDFEQCGQEKSHFLGYWIGCRGKKSAIAAFVYNTTHGRCNFQAAKSVSVKYISRNGTWTREMLVECALCISFLWYAFVAASRQMLEHSECNCSSASLLCTGLIISLS